MLPSFKSLPAFQVEILAGLVAQRNELRHQRRFGLRSVECHVLGVVGARGPIALRELCLDLDLDKGHGSRLVSGLVDQGLLERHDDPTDKRSFYLLLTAKGRRLHAQIHVDAVHRNDEWLAGLPESARAAFSAGIEQLLRHSQDLLDHERDAAAGKPGARRDEPPEPAARTPAAGPLVLVERARLEKLQEQLVALLQPV
jgi:DNA-binding MarR family transcriptional regulator